MANGNGAIQTQWVLGIFGTMLGVAGVAWASHVNMTLKDIQTAVMTSSDRLARVETQTAMHLQEHAERD